MYETNQFSPGLNPGAFSDPADGSFNYSRNHLVGALGEFVSGCGLVAHGRTPGVRITNENSFQPGLMGSACYGLLRLYDDETTS